MEPQHLEYVPLAIIGIILLIALAMGGLSDPGDMDGY